MKPVVNALFTLVKLGLGYEGPYMIDEGIDCRELYDMSIAQAVPAIACDGLQKMYEDSSFSQNTLLQSMELPENAEIKYNWFGAQLSCEKDYLMRKNVIGSMVARFNEIGVKTMLLKGQGLSGNYPVPSHRPTGDIDIFLFGDYDKVNRYLESRGVRIDYSDSKHAVFFIGKAMVENHKTFFSVDNARVMKVAESFAEKSPEASVLTEDGYYVPNAKCNYIFLMRHLCTHFSDNEGVVLRQLVDWGLFLDRHRKEIDITEAESIMGKLGLLKLNDIFTSIAMDITGRDLNDFIFGEIDIENKNLVLEDMINPRHIYPENRFKRMVMNLGIMFDQSWKYKLLPESFWVRIKRALQ